MFDPNYLLEFMIRHPSFLVFDGRLTEGKCVQLK